MNKETIDYTSEEFWATAPEGYDYYIVGINNGDHVEPDFHRLSGDQTKYYDNDECFWPKKNEGILYVVHQRPATFTKPVQESFVKSGNWFVDGKCVALPPVGTICEILGTVGQELRKQPFTWLEVEIIAHTDFGGAPIAVAKDMDSATLGWGTTNKFRPIKKEPTIQEKILDKWKAQSLEFAYDTKDSEYPVGSVIDFIVNNYNVKEK